MLTVSSAAATVLTSNDQAVAYRVTLALPSVASAYNDATLSVSTVTIDASMTTDVPAGTRLKAGYPAMQAQFTLSGLVDVTDETKTAAWLFGRYSTTSPLYRADAFRCPVTIDIGVYTDTSAGTPEWIRKFTGYVDEYTSNSDGSVQFTCIDRRSDLQAKGAIAAVVTAPPFNAGLTSEFAVDYLLRQCSAGATSSWPKQRANVVLAVGMRSSIWPEVGTLDTTASPAQPAVAFSPGVMGSGLSQSTAVGAGRGFPTYNLTGFLGTKVFVEFWVKGITSTDVAHVNLGTINYPFGDVVGGQIAVKNDRVTLFLGNANTDTLIPISPAGHYVGVALTFVQNSTWSATIYIDGTAYPVTSQPFADSTATWNAVSVAISGHPTIEALQVTTESSPTPNNTFSPTAVLDPSLNTLDVVPPLDAKADVWQTLQQIADAELAVLGFDESGVFRSKNRDTIASQAVARAITSEAALKAAGVKSSQASVVNRAQIGYTGYAFASTASTVYAADTVIKIPANSTITLPVTLSTPVYGIASTISVPGNGAVTAGVNQARFSTDSAGSAEAVGVTATVAQTGSDRVTITIVNRGRVAYAVSPANYTDLTVGTPLLQIGGKTITPTNEITADYQYPDAANGGAASTRFGEVPFAQSGNPWLQDGDTAMQLARDAVLGGSVPRPDLENLDIVPDPRLQIADRVHIQDPDVTGIDEYGVIFGWNLSASPNAYAMTLDVRTDAAPGGWLVGVAGRSEIGAGSSTTGATAYIYPST